MNLESGLSSNDVQHLICRGTYGGKNWKDEERQAACQRADQPFEPSYTNKLDGAGVVVIIIILIMSATALFTIISFKKISKKQKRKK